MLISVVIPVYNTSQGIVRTINSLLSQSSTDFEVIIVNDGSTDDSRNQILNKIQGILNFTLIDQINSGASSARNKGIMHANGQYLVFIDADDIVSDSYIFEIQKCISSTNEEIDLILFGYENCNILKEEIIANNKVIPNSGMLSEANGIIEVIPNLISGHLLNPLWNKVYNRKLLLQNDIRLDESFILGEDFIFNLDYFVFCKRIIIIEKPLYFYIATPGSLTKSNYHDKYNILYPVTKRFKEYILEHSLPLSLYYERLFRNFFTSIISSININENLVESIKYINSLISNDEISELTKKYKPTILRDKILIIFLKTNNPNIIALVSLLLSRIQKKSE